MKSLKKKSGDVGRTEDLFMLRADLGEKVWHCVELI